MKEMLNLKQIIKNLNTNNFILNCPIALEYSSGLPVLQIENGKLCLLVPYLRYKVTGEVDKTKVYSVRYVVKFSLPEMCAVGFEDLAYNPKFKNVDFSKPIGLFRHDAIKHFSKKDYKDAKERLFAMYDKIIDAILNGGEYTKEDEQEFKTLFNIMLEPSLKPIYEVLDKDFYDKYCN